MNRFAIAAFAALSAVTLAACSDSTDDVVQSPAPGAAPAPVTEQAADTATARAAIAFDMSRDQLEDGDCTRPTAATWAMSRPWYWMRAVS